ncbi:MAG: methyltransferase domain-containing protein [Nitrospinaceae bacterium]|jgi:SAM-dependent methyltransferase|nr:methyltransferase domain-containing protein [Nitrospinaceae bacterium]
MDFKTIEKEVKREFEEEWENTSVETLLETNDYSRAREEFAYLEKYLPSNDLILEAGCGLGPKLLYFEKNNYKMIGVDYILPALVRVKAYKATVKIAQSDVHCLPFQGDTFGAYLSYGVVEHFPQGPHQAILEAHRVLKPGGLIFMMVPADNFLTRFVYDEQNFLHRIKRIAWIRKIAGKPPLTAKEDNPTYFKLHGRTEMKNILEGSGFNIIFEKPFSHSFNLYLCCECFHKDSKGRTNGFANVLAFLLKKFMPWSTTSHLLFVGRK